MPPTHKKKPNLVFGRPLYLAAFGLLLIFLLTVNCCPPANFLKKQTSTKALGSDLAKAETQNLPLAEDTFKIHDELWADAIEGGPSGTPVTPSTSGTISLDVKDADLIDVLSMLAYRMDVNILFLGESDKITFKSENLSPLTTFQLLLQSYVPTQQAQGAQHDLDYIILGRNYIVGNRDRLHQDFSNRMLLTRFGLFYVSGEAMQGYIESLEIPVQSLTVDANQQALWMQGTPMMLGKAREVINSLDVMENAAFAEGGSRKIRMPVATASGERAEEELEALIDLLSILLDGFRDGRTDMGWVTWDHPDPIPYIVMDWNKPIIKPYDIKMKITRDFAANYENQIRYLIAEGTAANIDLVNQMIASIAATPNSPLSFERMDHAPGENEAADGGNGGDAGSNAVQQYAPAPQPEKQSYTKTYSVKLGPVPPEGGTLSGSGTYNEGSLVSISAVPAAGYQFVRWIESGAQLSASASTTFYLYADRTIEAVFSEIPAAEAGDGDELEASEEESD